MAYTNFENGKTALSDTNLNNMQVELIKLVFPVGSTYITQDNTNPSTILNFGTWERLKGRVCLGIDEDDEDFNTVGKTGGEKTHKLTVDEIPSHSHNITIGRSGEATHNHYSGKNNICAEGATETSDTYTSATTSKGSDQPHNNMQPYEIVGYMWIRRS